MPSGPGASSGSCLGGAGIAVSALSSHVDAAVGHALWLASAEIQRGVYYASGGQPANTAAWEDAELDRDSLGFFRDTRSTLDGAWVRPRFDGWLDVQDEVGVLINRALRGAMSDEACLDGADAVLARARTRGSAG